MENKNEEPMSMIIIRFLSPGSVNMEINFQNVIPLQAAAAAWLLDKQAQTGFYQQQAEVQQKEEMNKIAVPGLQQRKPITKPK